MRWPSGDECVLMYTYKELDSARLSALSLLCELDPFDPFIHKLCGFNPNESSCCAAAAAVASRVPGQQVNHSWSSRVREAQLICLPGRPPRAGQTTEQFVSLKTRLTSNQDPNLDSLRVPMRHHKIYKLTCQ